MAKFYRTKTSIKRAFERIESTASRLYMQGNMTLHEFEKIALTAKKGKNRAK